MIEKISNYKEIRYWAFWLSIILFIKALIILSLILYAGIGLGPDEAQYWTWSQTLDWAYYSKPPGIAWQIWLGTKLFGNTELGVRFMSVVLGFLLGLAVYALALTCKLRPRTAFWAGIVIAFSPLGMLASFLAITDVAMVFFWALGCIVLCRALNEHQAPNYYLLGTIIFCGALFKWPIFLIWGIIISLLPFYRYLINWHLIGGMALSFLSLLPSFIWNLSHNWVTFRHVLSTILARDASQGGYKKIIAGNFPEFVGMQIILLSPILFLLLIYAFTSIRKHFNRMSPALLFCGISAGVNLTVYSTMSIFKKMQGNWSAFAFPAAIVLLTWCTYEYSKTCQKWLKMGIALSIVLVSFGFSIPFFQENSLVAIPYQYNPFRHNVGWNNLPSVLTAVGYDPEDHFLFGDKYQSSSILSFYSPGQKRAYFLNLQNIRQNQFSFWPSLADEQLGRSGFFVLAENAPHLQRKFEDSIQKYEEQLKSYFKEVQLLGLYPLFIANGDVAKGALIFRCTEYNGKQPQESGLY